LVSVNSHAYLALTLWRSEELPRSASSWTRVVLSDTRLILLNMAADLSARARAAMRYFPPRSTDDVPTAPSLRLGVAMASVPILIVPSKHKASTALSIWRRLVLRIHLFCSCHS